MEVFLLERGVCEWDIERIAQGIRHHLQGRIDDA
jgi:hypothetical protein